MEQSLTNLRHAGTAYKRARDKADRIIEDPRKALAAAVRVAYANGVRKADILREIDHVWSRQWIDETVKDLAKGPLGGPAPEDWWDSLSDDDKAAFRLAADRPFPLDRDLAKKLDDARVPVVRVGFEGDTMEPVFTKQYRDYATRAMPIAPRRP